MLQPLRVDNLGPEGNEITHQPLTESKAFAYGVTCLQITTRNVIIDAWKVEFFRPVDSSD